MDEAPAENINNDGGENVDDKPRKRRNPFNTQRLKEERERRQKKRARLIVRNISYKSTEDVLRKHFEQWGTVEDVNILKRGDGKLVGCAFVQYESINQATKAILKGNNVELLGRPMFIDWALGKDEYEAKTKKTDEPEDKKPKTEIKDEESVDGNANNELETVDEDETAVENGVTEKKLDTDDETDVDSSAEEAEDDAESNDDEEDESDGDKKELKSKLDVGAVKSEKHISNDVQEGCTVFIRNVPFDAEDADLRKVCRKFGLLHYAIINREKISGHSKGTAFVKFKTKESADLCLQAGTEFKLLDEVLDPTPALSREEIHKQNAEKSKNENAKDSRNLYLAREGLIMANSKAADGVSASDMAKRHQLEQIKTQVLKNLNRFVSRNRLSIHNLPLHYDNEKLKQMALTYTGFRPHECRVMRENKITPEDPKGKSKGFGFLSFSTHQEALVALRKLNNNPKIFGPQHRPIVAFSIEDRAAHKIKEKRKERSKINNPTYQEKLQKRKERRKLKVAGKFNKISTFGQQDENKTKLQKHIKKLEEARAAHAKGKKEKINTAEVSEDYVGTASKPGTALRMRSTKKIVEQAQQHLKRVKGEKRKKKHQKIRQTHLAERKAETRPKQGRKVEKDDLNHLVSKYKRMIDSNANKNGAHTGVSAGKVKKPKRTKWYNE